MPRLAPSYVPFRSTPSRRFLWAVAATLTFAIGGSALSLPAVSAQESSPATASDEASPGQEGVLSDTAKKAGELADTAKERVEEFAERVESDERAHEARRNVLKPIYALAERLSFPAFHWVAFAAMATGVVSFALQLVLGKLLVLARRGFSLSEILSDALGLAISSIGLVLTTQAATENSSFTESAFSVLSASAVGVVAGFVFYLWGQRQELQALEARKRH
ncbi:MAG: hypothetical protein KDB14_01445 [Planctomycetales bacterium]|nr:hypothetical protein [Planctomycetales bacterium]